MRDDYQDILSFRRPGDDRDPSQPTDGTTGGDDVHAGSADPDPASWKPALAASTGPTRSGPARSGPEPFAWQDLRPSQGPFAVQVRLGKARVPQGEPESLRLGRIVTLDRAADDPVEILVDAQLVGYGRIVTLQGKLAIEILQMADQRQRRSA